jgi:DNA-directed RNA polymerase subunit RPC12/RpoP
MAIENIKCNSCGALLKADPNQDLIVCEYCSTPNRIVRKVQGNTETTVSLAHLAIQSAKERFGKSLSLSESSLPDLEDMLIYAISEINKYKAENKPTDKMIERTGEVWGSFLGEVMIRELGGSWLVSNHDTLFLLIDKVEVDPIKYITERMTGQASNSVLQFYSTVKEKISLSRKKSIQSTYSVSNFPRESASTIGIGQIILHLVLIFITGGLWLLVLIVWGLVSLIKRG